MQVEKESGSLVKEAAKMLAEKRFEEAKQLYLKASDVFGKENFAYNIELCERGLGKKLGSVVYTKNSIQSLANNVAEEQLAKTQALLERYFKRCQELEYQLMDNQK